MTDTLNRKEAPPLGDVYKVDFTKHKEYKLDNGIPVYVINAGNEDLLRIEMLFDAGDWEANKPLLAATANAMLNEGTKQNTGMELAEKIDYYGAFFQTDATQDHAYVTLYSLNKHLENVVPYLKEIIIDSIFPEKELKTQIQNRKQEWKVNNEKVSYLCRKNFNSLILGDNHPYSLKAEEKDYDSINRDELIVFYNKYYKPDNCRIIVSGKADENIVKLLNKLLGGKDWNGKGEKVSGNYEINPSKEKKNFINKDGSVQNAIRIGKKLFNKTHPDYMGMVILNTVFGGYFGSRLMTNIREDKGYTYGIGSGVASLMHDGMFYISTEVGAEVCNSALEEIYKEIDIIREKLIPEEELSLVKNYLMGNYLKSIDGPFALSDKFKGIMVYGLDYSYYDRYLDTLKNITSEQLLSLANQYLDPESMYELVVGKKD